MKNKWLILAAFTMVMLMTSCSAPAVPSSSFQSEAATEQAITKEKNTETEGKMQTQTAVSLPQSPWVSDRRVSLYRNGLSESFTLSETGIYCFAREKTGTYVLYCDKQSDQFVKLCSRVDCQHSDETCDACLDVSVPVLGYYKEKLYYVRKGQFRTMTTGDGKVAYENLPAELWRMDKDGRNKEAVTFCWEKAENITGLGSLTYTNGYVEGRFKKLGEDGTVEYSRRYTSLDHPDIFLETAGSKQLPIEGGSNGPILNTDGSKIIIQDSNRKNNPELDDDKTYYSLYVWDPMENGITYIGDRPNESGFFGAETALFAENGIVTQWNYQTYTGTPLFDTGIKTKASVSAFPDCLAVYEIYEFGDLQAGEVPEVTLRFYDWNCKPLGECKLDFDREQVRYSNFFFGETEDRLLIVKNLAAAMPDYYIEKSDFGTGEITLHEYHYPEMDLLE